MRTWIALGAAALLMAALALPVWAQTPNSAYVLCGLSPSIHRLNLDTGILTNNLFPVSGIPSVVRVHKNKGYILDSQSNRFFIFDLLSNTPVDTIQLTGQNPWDIAFQNPATAYVTNWVSDDVSMINLATGQQTQLIPCGPDPEGILVHNGKLYISCVDFNEQTWTYGPGRVQVYDLATGTFETTLWTNTVNPQALALDDLDRLHVVCTGNYFAQWGSVEIYDLATATLVMTIPIGGTPGSITLNLDGIAYLGAGGWGTQGYIYSYNSLTGSILHGSANPIVVAPGVWGVDVSQFGRIYACCQMGDALAELDSAGMLINSYAIAGGPQSVAVYNRPDLAVTLTPTVYPIQIPPGGGSFTYRLDIANQGVLPALFDVWIEAVLPNGTVWPILQRLNVELAAGSSILRSVTQFVPGHAPAGTYQFRGAAGYEDTEEELACDSFDFAKTGLTDGAGDWAWSDNLTEALPTQVAPLPADLEVQVHPNPFNAALQISFSLPTAGDVQLSLYDLAGRQVALLAQGLMPAGIYTVGYSANNLASGIYLYVLQTPVGNSRGRMLHLK